jgi:hypothetical protein
MAASLLLTGVPATFFEAVEGRERDCEAAVGVADMLAEVFFAGVFALTGAEHGRTLLGTTFSELTELMLVLVLGWTGLGCIARCSE